MLASPFKGKSFEDKSQSLCFRPCYDMHGYDLLKNQNFRRTTVQVQILIPGKKENLYHLPGRLL